MFLKISDDFTKTPGGRYKNEGKFSGEEFRDSLLLPKYLEARKKNEPLTVDLDGGFGYATSFIEEAFGGLVRELKGDNVQKNLIIMSKEDTSWLEKIAEYMRTAKK